MERRLARADQTARVRVARDELRRMRELSHAIDALETEIADRVGQVAPHLLAEPGCGPLTAAKLIGEIAGAARFASDANLARAAGLAPIPVSSGKTNRHRLDRGGNRQINAAIHRIAVTRARCHPETRDYIARKRAEGKTTRDAIRCLKRLLARRIWVSCSRRSRQRLPHFLDIDGMCRLGSVPADVYHHRPHSGLAYRTPREVAATWKDHDEQSIPAA